MEAYSIYLMISLGQASNLMNKHLPYDLAWSQGQVLLEEFEASEFNVDEKSEHDCINEFLQMKLSELPQEIQVCGKCGSTDVERNVWQHQDTGIVSDGTDDDIEDTWCNSCQGHEGIETDKIN